MLTPQSLHADYAGSVAVVTGAGGGIGRALALELARAGARVAVSDIRAGAAEATAAACRDLGAEASGYGLDVADRAAVFDHADQVVADFGGVDLMVNNAGVAVSQRVRELDPDDFRWLMEIDFWGVVHGTQAFLPHLVASGAGRLANISSVFGLIAVPKQGAYNAAKFAVRGLTEALIEEVRMERLPVTVSCVHPGGIRTDIARNARVTEAGDLRHVAAFDKLAFTTPERCAVVILRGVARGRPRILVGADARVQAALPRVLGSRYEGFVTALARRFDY